MSVSGLSRRLTHSNAGAARLWERLAGSHAKLEEKLQHQRLWELRAWNYHYEIGNDICKIERIVRAFSQHGPDGRTAYLNHFLRPVETRHIMATYPWVFDPSCWPARTAHEQLTAEVQIKIRQFGDYISGRWAAKEACVKATHGLLSKKDFEISTTDLANDGQLSPTGADYRRPKAFCWTPCSDSYEHNAAIIEGQVSISHDTEYATAVAMFPAIKDLRNVLQTQGFQAS